MAWAGGVFTRTNGTYSGSAVWQSDAAAAIKIRADRHDFHDQDLAQGINNCITKDGQNSPNQHISWGGFKITSLANGTAAGDAVNKGQLDGVSTLYVLKAGDTMTGLLHAPSFSLGNTAATPSGLLYNSSDGVVTLRTQPAAGSPQANFNFASDGSLQLQHGRLSLPAGDIQMQWNTAGERWIYWFSNGLTTGRFRLGVGTTGAWSLVSFDGAGAFAGTPITVNAGSPNISFGGAATAAGTIQTNGASAGLDFADRGGGPTWTMYANASTARWFGGGGDKMFLDTSGNLTTIGGLTMGGGKFISKVTLSTSAPGALANGELYLRY